jgi:outer membrane receptor for ferric coprogen and ferric-rhodotorulic acid
MDMNERSQARAKVLAVTLIAGTVLAGGIGAVPVAAAARERMAYDAEDAGSADSADEDRTEIIVTGAGLDTTGLSIQPRQTPQSVTVLDSARIEEQGLTDTSEVLEQVVGIQVNRTSALGTDGNNYVARGFPIENYMVDGIARPTGLYGFTEDTADMIAYDRIEVIRGSAGLMTGTGNPSASINMIRKRPGAVLRGTAAATLGSWGLRRVEGDVDGPLTSGGSLGLRVAGAWQENDNFIDREHVERQALFGAFEAALSPGTWLNLGVEYQNFRNKGASRGGVPLYYTDGTETDFDRSSNGGADWSNFLRRSVNAFASLTQDIGANWRLRVDGEHKAGRYDETIGYLWSNGVNKQTGEGGTLYSARWASDLKLDAITANLQGNFDALGQKQQIAITASHARSTDKGTNTPGWWSGAAYRRPVNVFDLFADGGVAKPALEATGGYTGNRVVTSAISGVVRLKPIAALSIIGGARATWWKKDTYSEDAAGKNTWTPDIKESGVVTPYAGVVFDISPSLSAYASYASVFQPQTYKNQDGGAIAPLAGNTTELGLKGEFFGSRLSANFALFRMLQDNYAIAIEGQLLSDGSTPYRAVSGVESRGFELEVRGEIFPGWQVAGGFANAKAKNPDGTVLRVQIPRNSLKLFTTYGFQGALTGLTVGGNLQWQSKSKAEYPGPNGEIYLQDALALIDLQAAYKFNENYSLTARVDNLFDKTYYTTVASSASRYGTPRSFAATIRARF